VNMARDAILSTVLALSAIFAGSVWLHRTSATASMLPNTFNVGDSFQHIIPEAPLGTSTFLVVVDSRCKACTASESFYRQLASAGPPQTRTVVLSLEDVAFTRQQLARWQMRPERVIILPRARWSHSTPTLGLLDRRGSVLFATHAPLSAAIFKKTTAALRSLFVSKQGES
jgi:hypothetical protein